MNELSRKATQEKPLERVFLIAAVAIYSLLIPLRYFSSISWIYSLFFLSLISVGLLLQATKIWYLRLLFRTPSRTISCIEDEDWETVTADNDGVPVYAHAKWLEKKAPLIFYIHGWSSNSSRSLNRCKGITDYHVLAMDLRGHGHAPDDPEFTAQKCAEDANALLNSIPRDNISSISIHGHSLGSFIAIRLQSKFEGWWKNRLKCLILESPMTNYNLILREYTPGPLFILRPLILRWMMSAWRKIHPNLPVRSSEDIKVPGWGRPEFPTLLIQAHNDERLGMGHHELLSQHLGHIDHENHVMKGLRHSGDSIHEERTILMKQYLERLLL